jgi:hypothetical protein
MQTGPWKIYEPGVLHVEETAQARLSNRHELTLHPRRLARYLHRRGQAQDRYVGARHVDRRAAMAREPER